MNEEELIQETRRLIGRWDNVRIVGQGWAGDARRGFEFNPIPTSANVATPVTTSGACCPTEGDCFIATQAICETGGGTYQGDDTTCDPNPCAATGICCDNGICSVTTEEECDGLWFATNATCEDVKCCHPYFEIHVQLVTCTTEDVGTCNQTIDLTAIRELDTVEEPDGCCTDQMTGGFGAVDENGNSINGSITFSSGGTIDWFMNVIPNCVASFGGCSFFGSVLVGDCDTGGTYHDDVDQSSGSGDCGDSKHCTAVGTIDIVWHG